MQPLKLVVRTSPLNGYGVFALDDIKKGEIVEQATFARTSYRTMHLISEEMRQICYTLPCGCDTCKHAGRNFVFSSGNIELYNHGNSEEQNVKFNWNHAARVIEVEAIKDITKGSEVLHSYGSNYSKFGEVS